ncbi:MAG: hypothetical protein WC254_02045 [Candidatus Woesearchaeota archaeon]|jgi:hypothetical protein
MGIFDIFQKKNVAEKRLSTMHSHVSEAFSTLYNQVSVLHSTIEQQKEWLKYLHENHLTLNNKHEDHQELTKAEVTRLNSWIAYLNKSVQKQENQLSDMHKAIQDAIKSHDTHLNQLYEAVQKVQKKPTEKIIETKVITKEPDYDTITQAVMQNLTFDVNHIKTSVKQEIYASLKESMEEQHVKNTEKVQEMFNTLKIEKSVPVIQQPMLSVQPMQSIQMANSQQLRPMQDVEWTSQLTNPEQKLLNLMISEADPLTYTKISQLTGHSINTVRVTMNTLKKKGFVEESTLPSGVKLFSVNNQEKIKKLYNVQVL